jgi:hypothetical protein
VTLEDDGKVAVKHIAIQYYIFRQVIREVEILVQLNHPCL